MKMGVAIALGAAIGAGLGVAFENVEVGLAAGLGVCVTLGVLSRRKGRVK